MDHSIAARQLGPGHDEALTGMAHAIDAWVVDFVRAWMSEGDQPIPSEGNVQSIRQNLQSATRRGTPLPEGYDWLPELLTRLAEGTRFNRRNFVNIHPSPHVPAILASTVVALQNPNNIVEDVSGPTTDLESECIAWIAENLIGFDPEHAWGNVVGGGTIANMTALLVARDYCYRKLARPRPASVRGRGLYDLPPGVVLATAGSHYSVRKALWFLGVGDENVVSIPVAFDERVRYSWQRDATFVNGITDLEWEEVIRSSMNADRERGLQELESFYAGASQPFSLQPLQSETYKALYACFEYGTPLIAYVFTPGTVDTGTIERPDAAALKKLAEEDVYIHADAATGGFALTHSRVRPKVEGLSRVHSVTLDGHKLGHLAYPNGTVVFRDKGWMYEILHTAPYLRDLAPTLEGSRPGSHVAALWAAIRDMGTTRRYDRWLDRIFDFVDLLVEGIDESKELQLLNRVDLTTLAVAPLPRAGETRRELNDVVRKAHRSIVKDTDQAAFLVNVDEHLSGVKVRDDNVFNPSGIISRDRWTDIACLRVVSANPAVELEDVENLLCYLEMAIGKARSRR